MPSVPTPLVNDGGLLSGTDMIPTSVPHSYIPCKGEIGVSDGSLFLPVERHMYASYYDGGVRINSTIPLDDDFPCISFPITLDRAPPWIGQSSLTLAAPCISPYNFALGGSTTILDTPLDADTPAEDKANARYVINPGLTISSRSDALLTGIEHRWSYDPDGTVSYPHPALRTGQTRYAGISGAAFGTVYADAAFLPATVGTDALKTANLKLCSAKKDYLLGFGAYTVTVKIGKAVATWDKSAGTLALSSPSSATYLKIYYSLDGTTPSILYSTPIALAATTTVKFFAKTSPVVMNQSDTFTLDVTFTAGVGPDDFVESYWSSLTAFDNINAKSFHRFQRRPDYYVSPSGTGDGSTPANAGSWTAIIGIIGTAGTAASGDLVWCAEGTYSNPTGTASTSFVVPLGVIVRGGFNADFTERDVKGRKSILLGKAWNSGTTTAAVNTQIVYNEGILDGFWGDTEIAQRLDTPSGYVDSRIIYMTSIMFLTPSLRPGIFYNCHVDWTGSFAGGAGATQSATQSRINTCQVAAFYQGGGLLLDCTSNIDIEVTGFGNGTTYTSGSTIARGTAGGGFSATIQSIYGQVGSHHAKGCESNVTFTTENAGAGGNGGTITGATAMCFVQGGNGGGISLELQNDYVWKALDCNGTSAVTIGNSGVGGNGGTVTFSTTRLLIAHGGNGGGLSLTHYSSKRDSLTGGTESYIATLGTTGNGGTGGTANAASGGSDNSGGSGGNATIRVYATTGGYLSTQTASATCGNTGNGGNAGALNTSYSYGGNGGNIDAKLESTLATKFYGAETTSLVAGDSGTAGTGPDGNGTQGTLDAWTIIGAGRCNSASLHTSTVGSTANPGTRGGVVEYGYAPSCWDLGSISCVEAGSVLGNGNPSRVNAIGAATGWYSGTPNGDGAPLAGYTTPQGTGVALGNFWE